MKLFILALLLTLPSFACISPTEPMKKDMHMQRAVLADIDKTGAKPGDRRVREVLKSVELWGQMAGPPQEPIVYTGEAETIDIELDAMAENRNRAAEDHKSGGFWSIITTDAMYVGGAALAFLGLTSIGGWLMSKSEDVKKYKKKSDDVAKQETKLRKTAARARRD